MGWYVIIVLYNVANGADNNTGMTLTRIWLGSFKHLRCAFLKIENVLQ